jgi:Rad3-related DNA helicase
MPAGNGFETTGAEAFLDLVSHDDRNVLIERGASAGLSAAIASGPVPPALLLRLARETGFSGTGVIENAVRLSPGKKDLFAAPRDGCVEEEREAPPDRVGCDPAALEAEVDRDIGRIQEALGETRDGQAAMARKVMTALARDEISFVEAGTGTGKSLAYLIPSAIFSAATGERVVVSTHTKNLQQQLIEKELPALRALVGFTRPVERLMGRENYICSRKLVSRTVRLAGDDPGAALRLGLAAALARDGAAESIPSGARPFPVRSISAPPRCLMNGCSHAGGCPMLAARRRAAEAALLLVNHSLLMTDFRQGGSVLGPYSRVIFDEAHHLEKCVMDNLSIRISSKTLERVFDQVEPVSPLNERWRMISLELESSPRGRGRESGDDMVRSLAMKKSELEEAYAAIFSSASSLCAAGAPGTRTRYLGGTFSGAGDTYSRFYHVINEMRECLNPFYSTGVSRAASVIQSELRFVDEELESLAESVRYLEEADDPDGVFWIEWTVEGRAAAICGSPLEIDRRFADYLEESTESAVFTSATLAENGSFNYVMERLGIGLTGKEPVNLIAGSPFDYEKNLLIMRTDGAGDPNDRSFAAEVAGMIASLSDVTGRRVMSLFTSYRMCLATRDELEQIGFGGKLLVQGGGMSREELASAFRSTDGSVLLGVASFWEGVDFPGGELEILVIPKLPFPVPSEPVIEARSERMEASGENPFTCLSLPEAILKLRQGVGRLIRRKDDRGVVVLMDPRLSVKSYAPAVLSSLPVTARCVSSPEAAALSAADWFEEGGM